MDKIKLILTIIAVVVAIILVAGFFIVKSLLASFDQIAMQYDNEVITAYQRELDYTPFDLDTFDKYEEIDTLITVASAEKIQEMIVSNKFTTVDLVKYYITRIKKYEEYNTVIQLNPKALEEAKAIDESIANGELKALHSVCFLIKDNISAVNMNSAAGAYALRDVTTSRDAFIVQTIKEQDGIILGKANLSEWSNFMSQPSSNGYSVLGGQTKNAYGKFDVGGSSSGPSAAAALNLATVTIGTETAGSLIYPAGQNSVITLKPTMGLLSRDLIIPISEAQDTAGVISRSVSDLNQIFNVLVKEDFNDHASVIAKDYTPEVSLDKNYLSGKRVGVVDASSEETQKVIEQLKQIGATVVEISLDEKVNEVDMMSVLNYGMVHDVNAYLNHEAVLSNFKSLKAIVEFNKSNPDVMPYEQALLEGALSATLSKEEVDTIIANNKKVTSEALVKAFVEYEIDVILSMSNELSGVYAACGYPALTVPAGYRESGEPYGLTFVGKYLDDQELIKLAYSYEQHTLVRKVPANSSNQ